MVTKPRHSHEQFRLAALITVTTGIITKVKVTRDLVSATCWGVRAPTPTVYRQWVCPARWMNMGKGSLSKCPFLNMKDSFLLSISLKPLVKGEYCLVFFFFFNIIWKRSLSSYLFCQQHLKHFFQVIIQRRGGWHWICFNFLFWRKAFRNWGFWY